MKGGQVQQASAAGGGEASGHREQSQTEPLGLPADGRMLVSARVCIQAIRSPARVTVADEICFCARSHAAAGWPGYDCVELLLFYRYLGALVVWSSTL